MQLQFSFDKEKTLNILLYVIDSLKRSDLHKVFKLLYFSDRKYLSEYGRPITGDDYIAMEAGPVPSKVYDICKIVRGDSYYKDDALLDLLSVENWMYLNTKKKADINKISPNEKRVIDECIAEYGDLSYDELKEKSHDIAWRSTARDFIIKVEDIAREVGLDKEELDYLYQSSNLTNIAHGTY